MQTRGNPVAWRCGHRYPLVVETTEGGKRARCLGCEEVGPVRADAAGAMWALKDVAKNGKQGVA